jgi:sigma-B regulation protein RsbU (phosphoserine phosphatase)
MRILVAEDERITRRSLQRQLERWGHDVHVAEDGAAAWEYFQHQEFDIVVTDWDMPRLDGRELIERIRGSGATNYVYLIMLTGRSEKVDLIAGMEAGADDFLSKPFDRNELRVRLNAGERIIRLERELAEHNQKLSTVNARMSRDLDAAAKVQQSLLPTSALDNRRVSCSWQFLPCDELAGDFLNIFALDDNHVAVYVVDVSGHGVASSLLSVTVGRMLTPLVSASSLLVQNRKGTNRVVPPAEVASELNRRFPMEEQNGMYFTMVYGVLALNTLEFRFVSAGHDPVVHVPRAGTPYMLEGDGMAIGWIEDMKYDDHVIKLKPGDRLYLYSDGVPEAMDEELNQFTMKRMLETIELGESQSLDDSVSLLLESVQCWCARNGPKDDVSILGLEIAD